MHQATYRNKSFLVADYKYQMFDSGPIHVPNPNFMLEMGKIDLTQKTEKRLEVRISCIADLKILPDFWLNPDLGPRFWILYLK